MAGFLLLVSFGFWCAPRAVVAQAAVTRADSALVARILTAEDRRDSASAALREGLQHRDARVRLLARRAMARIGDAKFVERDSLPAPEAPPSYPDAAWRTRLRALDAAPVDCARIRRGLSDEVWAVRLHAADKTTPACASDTAIVATLTRWISTMPSNSRRRTGEAGWRAAAHALVALARIAPADARRALPRFATSPVPGLRTYAARAAGVLADTATLRALATDANDNVREAGIDALSSVAGHASDDLYLRALNASGYQVIRAGARALKGSPRTSDIVAAAGPVLARLRADSSETSRDERVVLAERLTEAGVKDASSALVRQPAPVPLPRDAVALALGRSYRLRVVLADSSGGGSFIVRLRGDVAPIMAARVLDLARSGWYNGRTWYRVEPDFVIQGGGPGSNEYVGHPRFLRDELSALPQVRGTVGMSTRGHDTGDAQWFVNLRDNKRLTRDYTTFGEVVDGIDVVDGILEGDVIARIDILPAKPHD